MIDFNASQLTWIVIGACSIGGTGYLTMDGKMKDVTSKVEITNVRLEAMNDKMAELSKQLVRIEDKLDKRGSR
jgi:hypothetical protein